MKQSVTNHATWANKSSMIQHEARWYNTDSFQHSWFLVLCQSVYSFWIVSFVNVLNIQSEAMVDKSSWKNNKQQQNNDKTERAMENMSTNTQFWCSNPDFRIWVRQTFNNGAWNSQNERRQKKRGTKKQNRRTRKPCRFRNCYAVRCGPAWCWEKQCSRSLFIFFQWNATMRKILGGNFCRNTLTPHCTALLYSTKLCSLW